MYFFFSRRNFPDLLETINIKREKEESETCVGTDPYVAAAAAGGTDGGGESVEEWDPTITTTTADTTTTVAAATVTARPEEDDGWREEVDLQGIDMSPPFSPSPPSPDTSFDVETESKETWLVSEMRKIQEAYGELIKGQRRSLSEVEKTPTESSEDIMNFLKNLADTIVCLENVLTKKKIVTASGGLTFRYAIQPVNEKIQMRMKNIDHEIKQLQHQLLQNSPSNSITPAAKLEKSGTEKRKADDEDEVTATAMRSLKSRQESSLEKSLSSDPSLLLSPPPLQIDIPSVSPPQPIPGASVESLLPLLQLLYPQVNVIHQQEQGSEIFFPTIDDRFACADCGKVFTRKSNVMDHHRAEHEGVRYPCNKCNYQAKQKALLRVHMEGKHNGKRLRCGDGCNFQTGWKKSLRRHRKLCMFRQRQLALECKGFRMIGG